jgi:hypothetical protein
VTPCRELSFIGRAGFRRSFIAVPGGSDPVPVGAIGSWKRVRFTQGTGISAASLAMKVARIGYALLKTGSVYESSQNTCASS